ncbi:MAG: chalcone isomerase [Methylophaga sp.]|nr:chalcone isomerase [Methylophaga sp.]
MRYLLSLLSAAFLTASLSTSATELGGITMPDTLEADEQELVLNGAGIRSKFVFDLYVAGLYLNDKNSDADAIIASKDAMALRLHIISSKITSKKMTKATRKGFDKATGGKTDAIATEVDQFLEAFSDKIVEGDVFEFVYQPSQGVVVSKNSVQQDIISSLEFKQALFGIWLSDKPVKDQLKKKLLGL